jgi:hypothetical protein
VELAPETIRVIVVGHAQAMLEQQQAAPPQWPDVPGVAQLVAEVDGGMVPIVVTDTEQANRLDTVLAALAAYAEPDETPEAPVNACRRYLANRRHQLEPIEVAARLDRVPRKRVRLCHGRHGISSLRVASSTTMISWRPPRFIALSTGGVNFPSSPPA